MGGPQRPGSVQPADQHPRCLRIPQVGSAVWSQRGLVVRGPFAAGRRCYGWRPEGDGALRPEPRHKSTSICNSEPPRSTTVGLISAFEGRLEPHGDACLDQEPSWVVDEGVQRAAASQDRLPSPLLVVGVGVVDPRRRDVVELLAGTGPPAPGCDDVEDLRTAEAGDLHGTAGCEGRPWSLAPLWPADDVLPSSRPAEDFGALGPSTVRSVVAVRSVPAAGVMVGAGPKG
jgi:hypothetical protein